MWCFFRKLFSLRVDKHEIIDVPASFSPHSGRVANLFNCFCLAAAVAAVVLFAQMIYDDKEKMQYAQYFAYFTVWGLLCSFLYFVASWSNSCLPLRQEESATFRTKWTWVLFEVAAHTELTVTVLWGLSWKRGTGWEVGNILAHGGVMLLVLLTGLVANRMPVRMSHFIFPFGVDLVYVLWTFVHDRLSLGNGETSSDDDAIYDVIDWVDNFEETATLSAFALFVVSPILWALLYLLSLPGRRTFEDITDDYGSVAVAALHVGRECGRSRKTPNHQKAGSDMV